jgi:hypothetical protein
MPFKEQTITRLFDLGFPAGCEVPARRMNHRAFITVVPPRAKTERPPIFPFEAYPWIVWRWELPNDVLDKGTDYVDEFMEDFQVEADWVGANAIDEVERLLISRGVDPATMDAAWHFGLPRWL